MENDQRPLVTENDLEALTYKDGEGEWQFNKVHWEERVRPK